MTAPDSMRQINRQWGRDSHLAKQTMRFLEFIALIRAGNLDAVRAAVAENPDLVHTVDPCGENEQERTALHCAARHAHLDICKFLVEKGAEVYSHPTASYPAVFWAFHNRYSQDRPDSQAVVDYFLQEIPDKAEGTAGFGLTINIAARLGFTEIVKKHIDRDPLAVHCRGWIGDTPLHWSSHNGHLEIVELLLEAGADIEADEINCYGGKPLHWASEHEPEVVELLLRHGARVDSLNVKSGGEFEGITPLGMNALMKDDCAEVTGLLIAAGADSSVEFKGRSLIQIAEDQGNHKILEALGRIE